MVTEKTIIRPDLFVCKPGEFRDVDFVEEPNPDRTYREANPDRGDPNEVPATRKVVAFKNVPGKRMFGPDHNLDWALEYHPEYGPHCHAVNPFKPFGEGGKRDDSGLYRAFCPEDPFAFMLLKRNGYIDGVASGMFGSSSPEIFFEREKLPPDVDDPLDGITDDVFEGELYFYIMAGKGFGGSRVFCGRNVKFPDYAEYASKEEIWRAKKFASYQEAEEFAVDHNLSTTKEKGIELNDSWFEGFSIHFSTKAFTEAWKKVSEAKRLEYDKMMEERLRKLREEKELNG